MKGIKEVRLNESFFGAGLTSGELLRLCVDKKLGGLEFLQGIPTTLGGALFMNAGVENVHIGDLVQDVLIYDGKSMRRLPKEECDYAYKHSVFMQNGWTILGAYLRLEQCSATEIEERLQYYTQRRGHLPKGKSMGCVFKNPDGVSAGKLIEGAGLKGLRIGGAVVSDIHANFILNDKGATSQQIKTLIGIIKNAVFAQYRIKLEEEIRYLE
jgi:UDP-N-acetylmuramate dehydrogenase